MSTVRPRAATMLVIVLVVFAVQLAFAVRPQEGRSEAKSPFDEVRWIGDATATGEVRVRIEDAWYVLETIDGVPIPRLLAEIDRMYGRSNRVKRFEEDLIEVLQRLEVSPGERAVLRVRVAAPPDVDEAAARGGEIITIESTWTRERRQALRQGARDRAARPRDRAVEPADVIATFDALEQVIRERSAFAAALAGNESMAPWEKCLAAEREAAPQIRRVSELTRAVARVVASLGDAHASVRGGEVDRAGWLPLLPVSAQVDGGALLAVRPDRTGFLVDDAPVLQAIDGVPIERWIAAAQAIVPAAAPQLVRDRVCRALRDVEALRPLVAPERLGTPQVTLALESLDGGPVREVTVPLAPERPLFGAWPATSGDDVSRVIDHAESQIGYVRLKRMDDDTAEMLRDSLRAFARDGVRDLIVDVRGNGGGTREALFVLAAAIMAPSAEPVVINAARPLLVDGAVPAPVIERLESRGLRREGDPRWSAAETRAIDRFKSSFQPEGELPDGRFDGWWFALIGPAAEKPGAGAVVPEEARNENFRRVFVLQDAACFSATDVFLAALGELDHVTLVGEVSGGGSGAAVGHALPGRIEVRLSSMISYQPSGRRFDGVGVIPDVLIERFPTDALSGEDRWLTRACELMAERGGP